MIDDSSAPVRFPPFLVEGSRVALVAPASPFAEQEFHDAVARLGAHFDVTHAAGVLARDDYLAGSDDRRLGELQTALDDEQVRAVVAVRGGFGTGRIIARIDAARFAAQPKWLVGFSDITVLHAFAQRHGVASLHAPNAAGVGRSHAEAAMVIDVLRGRARPRRWPVRAHAPFEPVEGPAAGGNLTVLACEAMAGRWPSMRGRVLLLEDVGERLYRVDRMLAALADGGCFEGVRAVVFGHFTRCEGNPDGRTLERLVEELRARIRVPVVFGAPFGHDEPNEPFVQGALVKVSPAQVEVALAP